MTFSNDVEEENIWESTVALFLGHGMLLDHNVIFHLQTKSNGPKENKDPWRQNQLASSGHKVAYALLHYGDCFFTSERNFKC